MCEDKPIVPDEVIPPGGKPKRVLVVDDTGDKPRTVGMIGEPLQTEWEIKNRDFALATAFIAGAMGWGGGLEALAYGGKRHYTPTEKKPTKCGLPGCDKLSTRDYCCAEHCKEHRALQKARQNKA
jgi:hypothetical protein